MAGLKQRARTLVELAAARPRSMSGRGRCRSTRRRRKLLDEAPAQRSATLAKPLAVLDDWDEPALEAVCRAQAEAIGLGFGKLAQALRAALTGTIVSPGVFEIMRVLGRDEVLARVEDAATGRNAALPQGG